MGGETHLCSNSGDITTLYTIAVQPSVDRLVAGNRLGRKTPSGAFVHVLLVVAIVLLPGRAPVRLRLARVALFAAASDRSGWPSATEECRCKITDREAHGAGRHRAWPSAARLRSGTARRRPSQQYATEPGTGRVTAFAGGVRRMGMILEPR